MQKKVIKREIIFAHTAAREGRGHWTVNYIDNHRFINTFLYLLAQKLSIYIDWLVQTFQPKFTGIILQSIIGGILQFNVYCIIP